MILEGLIVKLKIEDLKLETDLKEEHKNLLNNLINFYMIMKPCY